MRTFSFSAFGLMSLLATSALARPRSKKIDDTNPIDQLSRVTAFVVTEDGLKVECWEINDLLPESQQRGRQHRKMRVGAADDGITGVDILTWPSPTPIWPPQSQSDCAMHGTTSWDDGYPDLYTVTDGLISIGYIPISIDTHSTVDEDELHLVFAEINGDNWFYIEDQTSSSSADCTKKAAASPFTVSSVSSGDTTLINFKYDKTPAHTVLHEGRCRFAGLKPASQGMELDEDLRLSRLTVQDL